MKVKKILTGILACIVLTTAAYAASDLPAENPENDMRERWEALSDQEKKQIYDIMDQRAETEFELLEKYAQLGLIDKEKALELHQHIEKRLDEMKKKGLFPGAGKGPREEGSKKAV